MLSEIRYKRKKIPYAIYSCLFLFLAVIPVTYASEVSGTFSVGDSNNTNTSSSNSSQSTGVLTANVSVQGNNIQGTVVGGIAEGSSGSIQSNTLAVSGGGSSGGSSYGSGGDGSIFTTSPVDYSTYSAYPGYPNFSSLFARGDSSGNETTDVVADNGLGSTFGSTDNTAALGNVSSGIKPGWLIALILLALLLLGSIGYTMRLPDKEMP